MNDVETGKAGRTLAAREIRSRIRLSCRGRLQGDTFTAVEARETFTVAGQEGDAVQVIAY
jgi:hypothetical protein